MTDVPSSSTTSTLCAVEVDVDTIRQTYDAVLWRWDELPPAERALLPELLRGHIELLMPEVAAVLPRMQGEQQRTAEYVLTRTRRMLAREAVASPQERAVRLGDLATQCRALLTLHLHPGPLDARPAGTPLGDRR